MAIADTIQSIKTHTQNAYAKIGEKGGTVPTNKNLENLSSSIESIPAGGGTDMLQSRVDETKSCRYLFYRYSGTNKDCVKNLNTSNVTTMEYMFYNCSSLKSLNVSSFELSKVTSYSRFLDNCTKLTEIKSPKTNPKTDIALPSGTWTGGNGNYLPTTNGTPITLRKN